MVGGGTTLIEAKLLNRKSIGIDINPEAIRITKQCIDFQEPQCQYEPILKNGNVKNLVDITDNSIDLILTHPPYLDIIKYSDNRIAEDLSSIADVNDFCHELQKGASELYRVLKENCYCAVLIGDVRKNKHHIPLSFYVMELFLKEGFVLKEDIIKIQHNCKTTDYWNEKIDMYNILMIMHEHLFIFRKPFQNESLLKVRYSTKK